MIIEVAHVKIKDGHNADFEAAVEQAVEVFKRVPECRGLHLQHCIEAPDEYQVVIRWDTLEAHTVTFREGPLFQEWRALVGPFFDGAPQVQHFEIAMPLVEL
ncbi:antibiotic biosynthesis monooxygenase family protein [Phaeobacter sp. C3_T13_0]|uniref:antibiotic biosynthesis monooxygenase family protein n=1 Tax=Phaeobacter cretensis TaxID=3342641 RepID=UPI0039BC6347